SATTQSSAAARLSPAIREFVKYDDSLIALTHVRVIDGTGTPPRTDQTLLIRYGLIAALGEASSLQIPSGAKVLDLSGRTVLPGTVGMHALLFSPHPNNVEVRRQGVFLNLKHKPIFPFPRLYLANGVTTIRTTASVEPYADLNLKSWIDEGKIPG